MSKKQLTTGIAVVAGTLVVLLFFIFGNPFAIVEQGLPPGALGGASGQLVAQDTVVGEGSEAAIGNIVAVHYTGTFEDGTVFDSSVGGPPFQFVLGAGQVIPGWDQGLQGMKAGGKRLLIVPSDLAYGPQGYGPIPPNATLIFEVELVAIVQ